MSTKNQPFFLIHICMLFLYLCSLCNHFVRRMSFYLLINLTRDFILDFYISPSILPALLPPFSRIYQARLHHPSPPTYVLPTNYSTPQRTSRPWNIQASRFSHATAHARIYFSLNSIPSMKRIQKRRTLQHSHLPLML